MKATITDISGWTINEWVITTGTREKCFVENPETGQSYFFKESIEKYSSEFWSEIIASKLGQMLGFNMLDYNIAILSDKVGCLCEMMIKPDEQELIHGISLIKDSVKGFKVSNRPVVNFQDVVASFQPYKDFILPFIDIMIFDCLIGNQDRHSENWAIIRSIDTKYLKLNQNKEIKFWASFYKIYFLKSKNRIPFRKFYYNHFNQLDLFNYKFAPIYDSGSSLGREINETSLPQFSLDEPAILKYIDKGKSEIRWKGSKINHFELIKKIKPDFKEHIIKKISDTTAKYSADNVKDMIFSIDEKLPINFKENALSLQRKELIFKFIDLRVNTLKRLIK